MLYNKNDSQSYVAEFKKRFSNFAEKAPLLLSYTTTPNSVQIIDESSEDVFEIDWDYSIPVKSFIFGIKQMLISKDRYPILHKVEETEEGITTEEQISMAVQGTDLSSIPVKRYKKHIHAYRIDKVIVFKDIFIIQDLDTEQMYRYRMSKSSVFFLKKIRSGRLNREQAASYFFENSVLLNEIVPKDEEISDQTMETMDHSMENLRKGIVSEPVRLGDVNGNT